MPRGKKPLTLDDFVRKAEAVHGKHFDYSRVKYVNSKVKVEIGCPLHGFFWQTPEKHWAGQGCPHKACTCVKLETTNMKKYGVRRPLQSKEIMSKYENTNMDRYGVPNVSMLPETSEKRKQTCQARYGVDTILSVGSVVRERIVQTNAIRYGGSSPFCSGTVREKAHRSILSRYGVSNVMFLNGVRQKVVDTHMSRYGVPYAYECPDIVKKVSDTKRKNGTFATSMAEKKLYDMLKSYFGEDDVIHTYNKDSRYPFAVDFYIRSRDTFLELNAHWTHGSYWFDSGLDADALSVLIEKAEISKFYANAVHVWSEADVRKRDCARDNNLNYVVFWDNKLRDARMWFDAGCPDSHDWRREYDWFFELQGD